MIARCIGSLLRSFPSSARVALLVTGALALSAAPARAQLKISQVYNLGGVSAGSTRPTDYVELYNPTGAPVTMTNWAIQTAASSTGTTWTVNTIPGPVTVNPGQYFLAAFTTNTVVLAPALPTPDISFPTINIADTTSMKIALTNDTVALTGADPATAAIQDFVGFGSGANGREPHGNTLPLVNNAPATGAAVAIYRRNCGAMDTNLNAADWANGAPNPRNSATPAAGGANGIGLAFPHLLEATQTASLRFTPSLCGTGQASSTAIVTVDLSSLPPLLAGTVMSDSGTLGDDLSGDGVYMLDVTIPSGTAPGSYNLPVTVADGASTGGAYIGLVVNPPSTPDNDNCSTAQLLAVPSVTAGSVLGATPESNTVVTTIGTPTTGMSGRRGVWYRVVGTGNAMTASLCGTLPVFDSVMLVMCGPCDALTVVGNNDDFCGSLNASQVTWCSTFGQTYWVWVAHFNSGIPPVTAYTLTMSDDGVPCCGAAVCATCPATVPPGSIAENEADLGISINDGCDPTTSAAGPLFTDILTPTAVPTVVRGKSRGLVGNRDTDHFRFQAPPTGGIFNATITDQSSAQISLFSLTGAGVCPATAVANSFILTRCGTISVSATLTANVWYSLRVIATGSSGGQDGIPPATIFGGSVPGGVSDNYSVSMTITPPGTAAFNDSCSTPGFLGINTAYTVGTTVGATNDGSSACDPAGRDLWYRLAMPCFNSCGPLTLRLDTCGSAIDTAISVYAGCGLAEIACNDDCGGTPCAGPGSCLTLTLAPGQVVLVRVSDKGIGAGGNFQVRAITLLANDDCAGAIPVSCPGSCSATTVGSANELPSVPTPCTGPGGQEGGQNYGITGPGVWYSVTSPIAQTLYADTVVGTSYDSKLLVYTGACATLSCVTVNDDITATPTLRSKVAWQANAGQTYYILVTGFSTNTGTFTLRVTCDPTPVNDLCSNPALLGPAPGALAATNVGATGDASSLTSPLLASCSTASTYWDTWYSYTSPCNNNLTLATCGSFDTILTVFTSCPTFTTSNQLLPTATSCNDNGAAGCTPGSTVTIPVTTGTTYLIRVATAGAVAGVPGGGQPFTLTWAVSDTDCDGTPDNLDGCPNDPNKTAPGVCGCGVSDVDTDGDTVPDCIDGCPFNPALTAPATWYQDLDGDGYGNFTMSQVSCSQPPGYVADSTDCNDGNPNVNPGQAEVCSNGIDDNCNGVQDEAIDTDGDGTNDCFDGCPTDPNKIAPGQCGCFIPDTDSDNDGTADCIDGCPNDPNKTSPGVCGCNVPDTDVDGDGFLDCLDNCPGVANPSQADVDADAVGDACDNCARLFNPGQEDCNNDGIGDTCAIVAGSPDCNLNGVPDSCDLAGGTSFDLNANSVPDECEQNGGSPFCFGNTGCPCGNNSALSEQAGCRNSTGLGGRLTGTGNTSVGSDTLSLQCSNLTGNPGIAVWFQSSAISLMPFSDGLKCIHGPLIRIGTGQPLVGGSVSYPVGTQLPVSVKGMLPPTGGVRYYQAVYRNNGGPCGTGLNITNGLSVVWQP
jgi:hypothetical protein